MGVVGYRLRQRLATQRRSVFGLTIVVAVVGGAVLTIAAGARRTASAPDRYTTANGPSFDGVINQSNGRPRTAEVAALPGAREVDSITFVFGGLHKPDSDESYDGLVFAGSDKATGAHLVAGRHADPANPGEFVATTTFVEANHATLGEQLEMVTITQAQSDAAGFDTKVPAGPVIDATLVGIIDGPADVDDPTAKPTSLAIFPPTVLAGNDIGVAATVMSVWLEPGVTLDEFRAEMDGVPNPDAFSLEPAMLVGRPVRNAVQAQGRGLWALAAVAAVAALVVAGQLITRNVRLSPDERSRLSAIGCTRRQIAAESMARSAVPIVAGTALAVGGAALLSGIFPTGFVRRIEPAPGLRFDTAILLTGAIVFIIALFIWTAIGLTASRTLAPQSWSAPLVDRVAALSPSVAAATGIRFAFIRNGRDRGSTPAAIAGLVLMVAGIVGATTFASSLDRLVNDPHRYGDNYDAGFGTGQTNVSDELRNALDADPDVAGLMLLAGGQTRVGDQTLRLVGLQPVKGSMDPKVLAGRLSASEDEIALGRLAARSLHVGIGDHLTLAGPSQTRTLRVTGLVVVPSVGLNDGIGQDGVVTLAALQRLDDSAVPSTAVFNVRAGAPGGTALAILQKYGSSATGPQEQPTVIANLARVRGIPFVLAGLLAALTALTLTHVLVTAIRNRLRDIAVLRSLGASRAWIARAMHWQATTFSVVPVVIGVPAGMIGGSIVFRLFADSAGTVDDASVPFALIGLTIIALLATANIVAAWPAHRARGRAAGALLRVE